MENSALILTNKKDQLLAKLNKVKDFNSNLKKASIANKRLEESKKLFIWYFLKFVWKFFKIPEDELKKMNQEELNILSDIIADKTKYWAFFQKMIIFIPFPVKDGDLFCSWYYLHYREILRKENNDYFPLKIFQDPLLRWDNIIVSKVKSDCSGYH